MAWTTPATATVGQVYTASFYNTQSRDNFAYLHGDAGTVALVAPVSITHASNPNLALAKTNATARTSQIEITGNVTRLFDSTGSVEVWVYDPTVPEFSVKQVLKFGGAAQMRGHRHPYANDRHIESGNLSVATGAGSSVTFTDAFASTPNVVACCTTSVTFSMAPTTVSTTGATFQHNSGSAQSAMWIAEGAD